ncbi:hypothetical protein HYQ45_003174 [Verticillium longisporum]|uniref:Elongator complex protein 6 n=3 Tax=Verticillium TaxID=1036719 RepID=G2WY11_VERDV|nr:uncharacterized protein VDAG_02493 [Verticillium dahliae VdLs.17]KAF3350973.1 Small COPII coat GTPase SAR1 [Verticillium dahliae VDG2]KAG7140091.1 hypothetical protein HYQ45_003174 [Verticillium longisporum]KAH6705560.1 hypothetical protein EV126DRAFT_412003 [Verticillium dahliae]EGY20969.1 hypothetical protein VDAG_02493 [Verticillium dahliae VdLs.17]PNH27986.1 hypothetical protein BJF96_g8756 [Verticillium dahliae]
MATRIPHLLEPYLALPPEHSSILLTNVLGASTNWLILRYLYSHLQKKTAQPQESAEETGETNVVLVSFMRDFTFWKDGAGKLGLDLESLARAGRFAFVDGLTNLFTPLPVEAARKGFRTLRSPKLSDLRNELLGAVADVAGGRGANPAKTIVIIDQPDLLLAATADITEGPDAVTGLALRGVLLDVQEKVHASVMAVAADEPLIAAQGTGLERGHAGFVLALAHTAEIVVSLRLLDTGGASDVSGVMRITGGGGDDGVDREVEEAEFLYFVGGDGSVKVFHRGQ